MRTPPLNFERSAVLAAIGRTRLALDTLQARVANAMTPAVLLENLRDIEGATRSLGVTIGLSRKALRS